MCIARERNACVLHMKEIPGACNLHGYCAISASCCGCILHCDIVTMDSMDLHHSSQNCIITGAYTTLHHHIHVATPKSYLIANEVCMFMQVCQYFIISQAHAIYRLSWPLQCILHNQNFLYSLGNMVCKL